MSTFIRWLLPAYQFCSDFSREPIKVDLTKAVKNIFNDELHKRKYSFGNLSLLNKVDPETIDHAYVTFYPRLITGLIEVDFFEKVIRDSFGEVPDYFKLNSHDDWPLSNGVVVLEIKYKYDVNNIPTKEDFNSAGLIDFENEFVKGYKMHSAVINEFCYFVLAGLHLKFPTQSYMYNNDTTVYDGFFQMASKGKVYCEHMRSSLFMHEVLIEKDKLAELEVTYNSLSLIWHHNLWSLKRYLSAVKSNQVSIDSLLDLIYALEGLFDKNTSSDFVKIICLTKLANSIKEAKEVKAILDLAYRIRNEIAHGGISYEPYDKVKLQGKEVFVEEVFWKMKHYVAVMIALAMNKVLNNKQQTNLRFNEDDLMQHLFV